ncbi:hypothetical protein Ddye_012299 [Dipteronia dyeriana]|uniref:HAT C-terminal dimerisation domain-containing protein n=1 Tax=Dipteronia dyeriana TaxID=168575 RepID=A0AAD9X424_9ROSI|nr:hypothetical protein Ddye_012299 [Dipteronia dyeriana]
MLNSGELETGTGANQIRTLTRPGATRWSSHYSSVNRLIDMFGATHTVLENTMNNWLNNSIRGEAKELMELDNRFQDQTMELLALSSTLDPTNHFESFNIDDICTLAKKFYPASTERAFSAMKLVKTSLRNKMDDDFLANCFVIYIERELADTIDSESIIDIFYALKPRSAPLR